MNKAQRPTPNPSKFEPMTSMSEWFDHCQRHCDVTRSQGISAERIVKMCDTMQDNVKEIILKNKRETEMRLGERISDIEQVKIELQGVSKVLQNEHEVMSMLRERIRDGIRMFKEKALAITEKCIAIREGRRGIDRSHDEVERELEIERKKIAVAMESVTKALGECEESMRMLRSALYFVGKDIQEKTGALSIECDCLNIKETSLDLTRYKGEPLDISRISVADWSRHSKDIMKSSWKKIHSARTLQVTINALLKENVETLRKQMAVVNDALQRRITEIKGAKARLQLQHYEITRKVNDLTQTISELETSIREKEAFLALAHTRLEKRASRRGIELVKDQVESNLVKEVFEIKKLINGLEKMLEETKISLRALLKTQLDLEEAINVKTNSLSIDEVDCMAVRQAMEYHDV
ncbi:UNVERIFIED_CONTAM: hypothetical protein PYX00_005228 [Menopon gallinae]|uniref:Tektin n=1 Tax=Menopon gallinae TaxID=328185 RepID=A0AAW2HS16_9NEOP